MKNITHKKNILKVKSCIAALAVTFLAISAIAAQSKIYIYAAASTTPALVFGKLINNCNAHLGKMQDKLSYIYTGKLAEVMSRIQGRIPKTLSLEEQTLFAMGYYQQIAFTRKQISDAASQKDQTKQPNPETDVQNT